MTTTTVGAGTGSAATTDQRFVYGARCMWYGPIRAVGKLTTPRGHALPCCPRCGGVLFELATEAEWWAGIDRFERGDGPGGRPHPGYRAMIEWQGAQARCFPTIVALAAAYERATGITVDVAR